MTDVHRLLDFSHTGVRDGKEEVRGDGGGGGGVTVICRLLHSPTLEMQEIVCVYGMGKGGGGGDEAIQAEHPESTFR